MLTPGTRLGVYELAGTLGAGAMGVVYRARDTQLNREIAIKILPESVSADADRVERFRREAQLLAQLNAPGIAGIYGLLEVDGHRGLVLELVEGPTLADRCRAGRLPMREALAIGAQLVDALDAAHERGIVHRDLKPANIKVTPDGVVKVLDFGLAKAQGATPPDASSADTAAPVGTLAGTVLGTPAYMSPEQARGRPVDKRTDVWAFGCVLFEMLTGRLAFGGETASDAIARVIGAEPDWSALPSDTPASIRRLLPRLLAKNAKARVRDIGDVRFAFDEIGEPGPAAEPSSSGRWWGIAATALAAVAVLLAAQIWRRSTSGGTPGIGGAMVSQLTSYDDRETFGTISPDGRSFVFVSSHGGSPDIWLRQISGGDPVRLTNDAAMEASLAFTADGESVFFTRIEGADTAIWRTGALGGQARKILGEARAASPSPDGRRLAWFVPETTGGYTLLVGGIDGSNGRVFAKNIQAVVDISAPAWSPDGRRLAYTSGGLFAPRNLFVGDVDAGTTRQVTDFTRSQEGTTSQVWLPDNRRLLVSYAGSASALNGAVDLGVVNTTTGESTRLTSSVADRFANPSISRDGTRLIVTSSRMTREVWKVPDGPDPLANGRAAVRLLDQRLDPMWIFVTRDSHTLLFNNARVGSRNLWTMPLDGSAKPRQITQIAGDNVMHSSLSPDGLHVAFVSNSGNSDIWVQHVDGSGLRQITSDPAPDVWPIWSPDGGTLMFSSHVDGAWVTRTVPFEGGTPSRFVAGFFRGDWIRKADAPGTWIVTSNTDFSGGGGLRLLDGETRAEVWKSQHPGNALPVFSHDARSISIAFRESRDRDAIWVYDVATGKSRVAARFPGPFQILFRSCWVDEGRAFVVNRADVISNVVMFDNLGLK